MQKFIYSRICINDYSFPIKRSFVIPVRNGDNAPQRKHRPIGRKQRKGKQLHNEEIILSFGRLLKRRRRNYFLCRYCRGSFIVPRTVFPFRNLLLLSIDRVIDTSFVRFFVPGEQRDFTNVIGGRVPRSRKFYPRVRFFDCLEISYLSRFQMPF